MFFDIGIKRSFQIFIFEDRTSYLCFQWELIEISIKLVCHSLDQSCVVGHRFLSVHLQDNSARIKGNSRIKLTSSLFVNTHLYYFPLEENFRLMKTNTTQKQYPSSYISYWNIHTCIHLHTHIYICFIYMYLLKYICMQLCLYGIFDI